MLVDFSYVGAIVEHRCFVVFEFVVFRIMMLVVLFTLLGSGCRLEPWALGISYEVDSFDAHATTMAGKCCRN